MAEAELALQERFIHRVRLWAQEEHSGSGQEAFLPLAAVTQELRHLQVGKPRMHVPGSGGSLSLRDKIKLD